MTTSTTSRARGERDLGRGAVLEVTDLIVEHELRGGKTVHAVSGVSLVVGANETLGIVGESGCGKSTTGRAILQLPPPTAGSVRFEGQELTGLGRDELRRVRRRLQLILQDPASSLNPRRRVRDIVAEGIAVWGDEVVPKEAAAALVEETMEAVGLEPSLGERRPFELSGGQCQRISLARALVLQPSLVICDEPVSALDVSVQAQILNLLEETKTRFGLSLVFISHDLAVVRHVSDRIAVMYLGKICEQAPTDELYARPSHPYTKALLAAIPQAGWDLDRAPVAPLQGEPPSPVDPPSGCRFRTRCPIAQARCEAEPPALREIRPHHWVACHFSESER